MKAEQQFQRRSFRVRNVMFTLNNPTEEELTEFAAFGQHLPTDLRYIVFQTEMGKKGTTHLQGYAEFKRAMRYSAIKAVLGERVHLEKRMGKQSEAIAYCKKVDTRVVDGLALENGVPARSRKDCIESVIESVKAKEPILNIQNECPKTYLMHRNKIIEYFIESQGRRHMKPSNDNVWIFYGPSGSGKTTTAWELFPNAYKASWPTGGRWWWQNYKAERIVIFDEFRENLSYQQMLALLDVHPMTCEWKGGMGQMVSKKIIITTIRNPKNWYGKVTDKSELERRIKENCQIFEFSGDIHPEEEDNEDAYPRDKWDMESFEFERTIYDNNESGYDFGLYNTGNNSFSE